MRKKRSRSKKNSYARFRKRCKHHHGDPEFPIASRESCFATVGLNFIRYIQHDAFQDPILAIVLQYFGRFELKPCSLFHYSFELPYDDPVDGLHSDSGNKHRDEARIEALCSLTGINRIREQYLLKNCSDSNLVAFLRMQYNEKRNFLKPLTWTRLTAFEESLKLEVRKTLNMVFISRETFPKPGLNRLEYESLGPVEYRWGEDEDDNSNNYE